MVYCPVCKVNWDDETTECPVCGRELAETEEEEVEWIILGSFEDKLTADFAAETLKSAKIPAALFSKSGFFGNVGLPLNPFYSSYAPPYEIAVPKDFAEEATETLNMVLGDKWSPKENTR